MLSIVLLLYRELSRQVFPTPKKKRMERVDIVESTFIETREEALGEVDIEEGTRRRRLVIRVGTRCTNTHEATMWLLQWSSVQSQWLCDR